MDQEWTTKIHTEGTRFIRFECVSTYAAADQVVGRVVRQS